MTLPKSCYSSTHLISQKDSGICPHYTTGNDNLQILVNSSDLPANKVASPFEACTRHHFLWTYFFLPAFNLSDESRGSAAMIAQVDETQSSSIVVISTLLKSEHRVNIEDVYCAQKRKAVVFVDAQLIVDLAGYPDAYEKVAQLQHACEASPLRTFWDIPTTRISRMPLEIGAIEYVALRKHKSFDGFVSLAAPGSSTYEVIDLNTTNELVRNGGIISTNKRLLDARKHVFLRGILLQNEQVKEHPSDDDRRLHIIATKTFDSARASCVSTSDSTPNSGIFSSNEFNGEIDSPIGTTLIHEYSDEDEFNTQSMTPTYDKEKTYPHKKPPRILPIQLGNGYVDVRRKIDATIHYQCCEDTSVKRHGHIKENEDLERCIEIAFYSSPPSSLKINTNDSMPVPALFNNCCDMSQVHELEFWMTREIFVRAFYDFNLRKNGTLSVQAKEQLVIICLMNTGWAICRNSTGELGYIPTIVIPRGFHSGLRCCKIYARMITFVKKSYRSRTFSVGAGTAIVVLVNRGKWVLVRILLRPYLQGHIPRNRIFPRSRLRY